MDVNGWPEVNDHNGMIARRDFDDAGRVGPEPDASIHTGIIG